MLYVGVLEAKLYLHGCQSLKEKRRRLVKLRDKFGKLATLAVCESDNQDHHNHAQWSFVAASTSRTNVEQVWSQVETFLRTQLDAELIGADRSWLS